MGKKKIGKTEFTTEQVELMKQGYCARKNKNYQSKTAQHPAKYPFCHQPVKVPGAACHRHGGNAPKGIAHYRFDKGRYSKHMPERMAEEAERTLNDPARHAFDDGLGLLDALIADRFQSLSKNGTEEAWGNAAQVAKGIDKDWQGAVRAYGDLHKAKDEADFAKKLEALGRAVELLGAPISTLVQMTEDGYETERNDAKARTELKELATERRRHVSAEHSRRYRERVSVTMAELAAMLARQQKIIAETVRAMLPGDAGNRVVTKIIEHLRLEQRRALPEATKVVEAEYAQLSD